jgi:hypothetical protein
MKLLLCPNCSDVKKLDYKKTFCKCRKSWGNYQKDGRHADIYGEGIVIGLSNPTLSAGVFREHEDENYTISAWIMGTNARNVIYHREETDASKT